MGIQFYKELWASCILTPLGVHLRWKLATLNGRGIGPKHRLEWVPWGTLICNLTAVIIAVIFEALRVQYLHSDDGDLKYPWILAVVVGK
jgi:fluoride ion exporter CrcB/FEX